MDPQPEQTPNQIEPQPSSELIPSELGPISRIGVETVLSKLPIHNLAKKGRVDIQITHRGVDGQVDLRWEVSYNERYGQPRQLAYKLDTIVINRRIDQEGRPLPRLIRLGSLNELCADLGSQKNELKRAIRQNATTSINAKLKYRASDGNERELEALFTRYSVVFTGEKLPDGREADGVYVVLNEIFRDVLNNAPIRPLNYDYLKGLPPASQRFYEIISGRIYAALKNRNPLARIPYSEFCMYSALTRHFDHENFRVQMAKIHRPHLKSGYIARLHYEQTTDAEGKPDWMMCYAPGPRARAEYMTFARKTKRLEALAEPAPERVELDEPEIAEGEELPPLPLPEESMDRSALLAEMTKRGITEARARKLLAGAAPGQQIMDQLEWGDYLIQSQPRQFKNPSGFYVYLLAENVSPPPDFESSRLRKLREEARRETEESEIEQLRLEEGYKEYKRRQTENYIREHVSEYEMEQLVKTAEAHVRANFKNLASYNPESFRQVVQGIVRAEISRRVPFLSFQAYCEQQSRQPKLFDELGAAPAREAAGLRQRYEEFCRAQAQAVLDALSAKERSARLKAARMYLLNEHPERDHFHALLSEERYEEFRKHSEEQLMADTIRSLNLVSFEAWKQTLPATT